MLSVFPELFILSFFVPFILRVVLGVFFFLEGWSFFKERKDAFRKELPEKFGTLRTWAPLSVGAVEIGIGLFLIAGFLTQVAALLGLIAAVKFLVFRKAFPTLAPHTRLTYALLSTMLLSLLILGPGAFAIDLPL
ncbi:hypothetical protein COU17_03545 [Candidatus Kaiserbacteria bacterium CG10_big_fil_rev_8_21_14_0_10_49_17]|uniref:DoxX family protein n=1 Tax=Candidatus Kaiserbacteria bacterium CG10_big_fil_rev_8_21_14_0_10_49_17 TaxID=1974609 RepID=A0A2M6WDG7_9BACT|nr:MAG: hypothetical protein COU17_03545 [Candidatus Kaiserbacteria bacterium CG10_big_fil_rev_8_21_14_0_10_49_17]